MRRFCLVERFARRDLLAQLQIFASGARGLRRVASRARHACAVRGVRSPRSSARGRRRSSPAVSMASSRIEDERPCPPRAACANCCLLKFRAIQYLTLQVSSNPRPACPMPASVAAARCDSASRRRTPGRRQAAQELGDVFVVLAEAVDLAGPAVSSNESIHKPPRVPARVVRQRRDSSRRSVVELIGSHRRTAALAQDPLTAPSACAPDLDARACSPLTTSSSFLLLASCASTSPMFSLCALARCDLACELFVLDVLLFEVALRSSGRPGTARCPRRSTAAGRRRPRAGRCRRAAPGAWPRAVG